MLDATEILQNTGEGLIVTSLLRERTTCPLISYKPAAEFLISSFGRTLLSWCSNGNAPINNRSTMCKGGYYWESKLWRSHCENSKQTKSFITAGWKKDGVPSFEKPPNSDCDKASHAESLRFNNNQLHSVFKMVTEDSGKMFKLPAFGSRVLRLL